MKKQLTKAQQRVAIARDVIKQLDSESIIAKSGVYVERAGRLFGDAWDEPAINQSLLLSQPPVCKVCARGAMFMASVRKFNRFDGIASLYAITTHLVETVPSFTHEQMNTIERVFEYSYRNSIKFNNLSDDQRLRFICRYIIKNRGKVWGIKGAAGRYGKRHS